MVCEFYYIQMLDLMHLACLSVKLGLRVDFIELTLFVGFAKWAKLIYQFKKPRSKPSLDSNLIYIYCFLL